MRRKSLIILALLAAPLVAIAQSAPTQIVFSWTYSASLPVCPATSPANCLAGFTLTDTTTGIVIAGPSVLDWPSVLGSAALSYTYTPTGGLYYGTHSFSLVANGYDGSGKAITSSAVTTSVMNALTTLQPPTGFSGKVQ